LNEIIYTKKQTSLTKQQGGWGGTNSATESYSDTASDGAADDEFGQSVSINGDYAIVGAYYKEASGNSHQGKAYIFHRSGTTWTEQAGLAASDGRVSDSFGGCVSISGDYAVIGADQKETINYGEGVAYIFHRNGTDWGQQVAIVGSDQGGTAHFGEAVSISGNYIISGVGLWKLKGKVYFYKHY